MRTLDVADDGTRSIVHELDADLSDTTTRASTAEDACCPKSAFSYLHPDHAQFAIVRQQRTCDLDELDGLLSGIHDCGCVCRRGAGVELCELWLSLVIVLGDSRSLSLKMFGAKMPSRQNLPAGGCGAGG